MTPFAAQVKALREFLYETCPEDGPEHAGFHGAPVYNCKGCDAEVDKRLNALAEAAFQAGQKAMEKWTDHWMSCDIREFPDERRICTCGLTAAQEGR